MQQRGSLLLGSDDAEVATQAARCGDHHHRITALDDAHHCGAVSESLDCHRCLCHRHELQPLRGVLGAADCPRDPGTADAVRPGEARGQDVRDGGDQRQRLTIGGGRVCTPQALCDPPGEPWLELGERGLVRGQRPQGCDVTDAELPRQEPRVSEPDQRELEQRTEAGGLGLSERVEQPCERASDPVQATELAGVSATTSTAIAAKSRPR
jgi:hypothetical protein